MAGITQVIPTYVGGMSEQPDHIKSPGQVNNIVNGIPDVTYGSVSYTHLRAHET